ncbi:MAG: 4'-phosphopantetheinyl transferase superfamily protein [Xanthomonadaceae bacterium]|jgi:4'-phosphopantetheinyl transferase|nr:4'-phosphopantetheinyl transferase superfamily protein [Xanthomonadaceae bacterium]
MPEFDIPATTPDAMPIRIWVMPHSRVTQKDDVHTRLAIALGCTPQTLPLTRDVHGRPRLGVPYMDYDLNWSHSGDLLLLALGKRVRLGIDVEKLRDQPRALDLARRFFHPSEADQLQRSGNITRDFFRFWCAKEAILKAHGRGIAFGLNRVIFTLETPEETPHLLECDTALGQPDDWNLHLWRPCADYFAMLAWRQHTGH